MDQRRAGAGHRAARRRMHGTCGNTSPTGGFVEWNGGVYFEGRAIGTAVELWRSDGTTLGTALVEDIEPGTGSGAPREMRATSVGLLFSAREAGAGREPWISGGTPAGTMRPARAPSWSARRRGSPGPVSRPTDRCQ